ncbi:hypothetical protein [Halalkalibacillus sediminis]|uniref:hypothetical protein n=1 Tax=Halalkalibacillus sediminis TaxID=2018042 RepID=UPI00117A37CD|nr:hypothetical protein [Halalkalibacillus sediminis]
MYQILCFVVFMSAFLRLKVKGKLLTGLLLFGGSLIHFYYGNSGVELLEGITQNLALLSIILLAPLISIPLKQEGVIQSVVSKLVQVQHEPKKMFYGISSFVFLMSPILNMGSLRIVHSFIGDIKVNRKLLSNAYYQGFTPAVLWSPFFASVGMVLYLTEISYLSYLPIGLVFVVIQIILAVLLLNYSGEKLSTEAEISSVKFRDFYNTKLVLYVIGLIMLLVSLELMTNYSMLLLVSIMCVSVPIVYNLIVNKWGVFYKEFQLYKKHVSSFSSLEISLFLSAGLFGNALLHTPITDILKTAIIWSTSKSVFLLFFLIIVLVTLVAMMGIHQIVIIPIILTLLISPDVGVNLYSAAFMCIFTWMFSAALSPLNALNIIISQCVRNNGLTVAYRWNGLFFAGVFVMAFVFVYLIDILQLQP